MSLELIRELNRATVFFQARQIATVLGAPQPESLPQYDRAKVQKAYDEMMAEREAEAVHAEYEALGRQV